MLDCDYCEASFETEDAHLEHVATAHEGELGRIDRRRVADRYGDDGEGGTSIAVLGGGVAGVLVLLGLVGFLVIAGSDDAAPTGDERIHEHGQLTVSVDGQEIDFAQPQYGYLDDTFHIHHDEGDHWHMHPVRVDLAYAMDALGLPITDSSITIDDETYDDADPETDVSIRVNGEPVAPSYELHDGDHVEIVVESGA